MHSQWEWGKMIPTFFTTQTLKIGKQLLLPSNDKQISPGFILNNNNITSATEVSATENICPELLNSTSGLEADKTRDNTSKYNHFLQLQFSFPFSQQEQCLRIEAESFPTFHISVVTKL